MTAALPASHGFTKVADRQPSSTKFTAKNARSAKVIDFLSGPGNSEFLYDIHLVKPWSDEGWRNSEWRMVNGEWIVESGGWRREGGEWGKDF